MLAVSEIIIANHSHVFNRTKFSEEYLWWISLTSLDIYVIFITITGSILLLVDYWSLMASSAQ
jgi:hypothetical protein